MTAFDTESGEETQEKKQTQQPRRLLILVKARHAEAAREAWDNPDVLMARAVRFLQHGSVPTLTPDNCRLMAVDRWPTRTFVVCDLFHHDYDFDTAHLAIQKNNLPVIVLHRRQSDEWPFKQGQDAPGGDVENMVNTSLQEAHEAHGWREQPPFKIDHKDGVYPVYHAPRSLGRGREFVPEADVTYSRNPVQKDGVQLDFR
ncbi:hypothetical protein SPI_06728 [Niveomyces insectorum RCEF 264]|uniref:Uncharacterized protein n=1 Tax=Niveomyces insectorum RCEF 264 TaxID=1081102 RepID=A0A167QQ48_9HYPO|nr:hypothetical protein SPI_06728 [Niveomyces insectorum RCEF 264]